MWCAQHLNTSPSAHQLKHTVNSSTTSSPNITVASVNVMSPFYHCHHCHYHCSPCHGRSALPVTVPVSANVSCRILCRFRNRTNSETRIRRTKFRQLFVIYCTLCTRCGLRFKIFMVYQRNLHAVLLSF
jgi:hypothetical protein